MVPQFILFLFATNGFNFHKSPINDYFKILAVKFGKHSSFVFMFEFSTKNVSFFYFVIISSLFEILFTRFILLGRDAM